MWLHDYNSERDNPYRIEPFVQISHLAFVDNGPKWQYPRHLHEGEYEVVLILSGEGNLHIWDMPYEIRQGMVAVIPPNVYHRFVANNDVGMGYCTLRFREDESNGDVIRFYREHGCAITNAINYYDLLKGDIQLMLSMHRTNDGVVDGPMQSIALSYLQCIRYLFENESVTLRLDDRYGIGDVLEFIEKHKEQKISLDSLSFQFGISSSQLNRIFRKAYNTTPINYLIDCRMAEATELLMKTDLSVTEIAIRVGYPNLNHFINMFMKRIGCTPDEYRRKNGNVPVIE